MILEQITAFEKGDAPVRVNRAVKDLPNKPTAARYDEYLVQLALRAPDTLSTIDFVSSDDFDDPILRDIWQALLNYNQGAVSFDENEFIASLSDEARATGERLRDASKGIQFDEQEAARELEAAAYRLRLQRYSSELTQLRYLLSEAPPEEQIELTQRVSTVSSWIADAKRALDARTVLKTSAPRRSLT